MFLADDETEGIVMIGEIGGTAEEEAAEFYEASGTSKPIAGFIAGLTAPPGRPHGPCRGDHRRRQGQRRGDKIEAMKSAGFHVADSPAAIGDTMLAAMQG